MTIVIHCVVRNRAVRASPPLARESQLHWPCLKRIALDFGKQDPLTLLHRLLAAEGLEDPEQLREAFHPPRRPLLCRAAASPQPRRVARANPRRVLEDALWLGLATPWLIDPRRPVLWTRASLTRGIEVYEPMGFYA